LGREWGKRRLGRGKGCERGRVSKKKARKGEEV